MLDIKVLFVSGRSATIEIPDGGLYHTLKPYRVAVNGAEVQPAETVVHSMYGLWPDTEYTVQVFDGDEVIGSAVFRTEEESFTLNVRRFGAVGDGVHDDTAAIQAAINCCPPKGICRRPLR